MSLPFPGPCSEVTDLDKLWSEDQERQSLQVQSQVLSAWAPFALLSWWEQDPWLCDSSSFPYWFWKWQGEQSHWCQPCECILECCLSQVTSNVAADYIHNKMEGCLGRLRAGQGRGSVNKSLGNLCPCTPEPPS